jgi:hypothetical protein
MRGPFYAHFQDRRNEENEGRAVRVGNEMLDVILNFVSFVPSVQKD